MQDILSGHLSQHERDHLEQNLDAICNHDESNTTVKERFVDQTAFAKFLAYRSPQHAEPVVAKSAPILFRMLVYMSNYPLAPPAPQSLTKSGFRRAIVHAIPRLSCFFMDSWNYSRERTPADMRRLVFQGLAVPALPVGLPSFDDSHWTAKAQQRAVDFENQHGLNEDVAVVNRDGDGDEIYHDMLDFLFSSQPEKSPWYAPCHRDGFRGFGKKICWSPPLHELVVTRDVIVTLVELGLTLQGDEKGEIAERLLRKADIVNEFVGSLEGCNFEMFDNACKKHLVSTPLTASLFPL